MKSPRHHPLTRLLNESGISRLKSSHPWLYRTNLREPAFPFTTPGLLRVGTTDYLYSPQSEIRLRRWGPFGDIRSPEVPDGKLVLLQDLATFESLYGEALCTHFSETLAAKKACVDGDPCFRWIYAESDLIPGLVVDVFDTTTVAQIQSAPVEHFWPVIRKSLTQAYREQLGSDPAWKELRNMPVRRKEGLEVVAVEDSPDAGAWTRWNGFEWWMNPGGPQKTGAYLDQRDNHLAAARWAQRMKYREAWDLCSFEGGFSLHLLKAGLKVEAVDQSGSALEVLKKNVARNQLSLDHLQTLEANIFDELRQRHQDHRSTDLIILDPPSFVRARTDKESALRGLKELNLRALLTLKPGGMLVTCTCSYHISPYDLAEVVQEAALDSRRRLKCIENRGPSPDHAPLVGFPESNYLQALYLEVL